MIAVQITAFKGKGLGSDWLSMKCLAILALSLITLATPLCAATSPQQIAHDITALTDSKIVSDAAYWWEHLADGGKCDGAKVAVLITEIARMLEPGTTAEDALAVLSARGMIGTPDYWQQHAVAGGICDSKNVSILFNRAATRLPVPIPASVNATPLPILSAEKIRDHYDIVIAGAGTGGCGAAVQAARMGKSVLLLEETDWIGGQMNAAAVTSMDEGGTLVRERGLYREWCGMIAAHYRPLGIDCETAYWHRHVCVEPRVGRTLLRTLLGDARGDKGILDLVCQARVIGVTKSGDQITGVKIECVSPTGKTTHEVSSKILIDATEWGDVIPLTGARYRTGNCISGEIDPARHIQSITWTAVVKQYPDGVPDTLRVTTTPPDYAKYAKSFAKGLVLGLDDDVKRPPKGTAWGFDRFIGYRGMPDSSRPPAGRVITRTHLNYSNDQPATIADLEDPTVRIATCRTAIVKTLCLLHYIQTEIGKSDWSVANDEGFDTPYNRAQMDEFIASQPDLAPYRAVLYHFSIMPYARESRRIIGIKTLTAHEIERVKAKPIQFPNTVAIGDYAVDLHGSMSAPYLELDLDHEEDIPHKFGERGVGPFAIPFECFIPEKIDGFLPAEKNISQSRMVNGATRLQPHTMLMGQAAGAIAALAIEQGIQPRALDPIAVQNVLLDAGCPLTIDAVAAPRDTPEWKAQQLEVLHGAK